MIITPAACLQHVEEFWNLSEFDLLCGRSQGLMDVGQRAGGRR